MSFINEDGAVVDPSEIAAALQTTAEELQAEDEAIAQASLESLLDSITAQVSMESFEEPPLEMLEPAMESILSIARDIQESGAISRSDAQTLRNMTASLEGFQDSFASLPLNSFTEMPSKVNFDVSMESIFSNMGRKIIEIIKAIIKWIKDKAKAFVGLFRNNRTKAKQTEEAAKKVDDALKSSAKAQEDVDWDEIGRNFTEAAINISDTLDAMKANRSEWDRLRQKLGDTHINGWAKGAAERAKIGKVQLDLPMLATALAGEGRTGKLAAATTSLNAIATQLQFKGESLPAQVVDQIVKLDDALFEDNPIAKPEPSVSGCAKALRQIVTRLNREAADVDILTVEDPERVVRGILGVFEKANLTKLAEQLVRPLSSSSQMYAEESEKLHREIAADQQKGTVIAENDPRVVRIREFQERARINEDIDVVYRSIMNAFAKVTKIGADLAKNPASLKAA